MKPFSVVPARRMLAQISLFLKSLILTAFRGAVSFILANEISGARGFPEKAQDTIRLSSELLSCAGRPPS